MKLTKYFISAGIVAASLSMGSCVGDLDLTPTSPNDITPGTFPSDPKQYMEKVISDIYLQTSTYGYGTNDDGSNILTSMDGGMSTFQRSIFNLQEIPSDEANWQPSADAIDPNFQYGRIPSTNQVIMGAYSRMMVIVTLCNQFMQTDFGVSTEEEKKLFDEFSRQARIIRGGMYFYLIDAFGNVPWADETVMTGQVAPQLSTDFAEGRRMVFDKVTADLEDIVKWYKDNDPANNPPYGYVGLDVAESLLVKFYLNAQVYTGTPRWTDCFSHAEAVIGRRGHGGFNNSGLSTAYHKNFSYNNKDCSEIIWRIVQESATLNDGAGLKSYANGGFMCNAWIGDSGEKDEFQCKQADYNSANGWKCMSARRQFVEIFNWNSDFTASPDIRTKFWKTAKDGFNIDNEPFVQANWGRNGFLPVKYTNWYINDNNEIDKSMSPQAVNPLGIDYGMIRLAEIYLSAAEAALQGGGPADKAVEYANYVRQRAGFQPYTTATLTLQELQYERCRELYTECTRRTDLIRYGKWISGYTWNWKYGAAEGTDFPSYFNVYAIPNTVVERNGYKQNPGY